MIECPKCGERIFTKKQLYNHIKEHNIPKIGKEVQQMDYGKEKENMQKARERNWWKATTGKHEVKILCEPEEFDTEWEKKTIHKVRLDIEVNGENFAWGITKGITENSLYGQLVLVGESKGKLEGETINLIVKGSGKEVEYTVEEALPLMTKEEEKVK